MHLAKGLEFRAVAVMACDDDVLPLQERIESVADEAELDEVYETERHLFYVACTRARDRLLVSGVAPGSEFCADLSAKTEAKHDPGCRRQLYFRLHRGAAIWVRFYPVSHPVPWTQVCLMRRA